MTRFLMSRLIGSIFTLFVSSLLIFSVIHFIPGDPIGVLLQKSLNPEVAAELRRLYGFDRSLADQYLGWLGSIMRGDFGVSVLSGIPVGETLGARIPRTLFLMLGGIIVALVIAVPIAIIAATHRRSWMDLAAVASSTMFLAIPIFWLALVLLIVFAVKLHLLPAVGYTAPTEDFVGFLRSMALPSLALGLGTAAYIARVLRSSLLDVLDQDYIVHARSKGLRERDILRRYALRNAAIPMITVIGLEMGALLGGAVVVERVFAYPGMGSLIIDSITARDYPLIQASIAFFAAAFIVVNFAVDALYGVLDPRIRRR